MCCVKTLGPRKALTCIEDALVNAYSALKSLGDKAAETVEIKNVPGGHSIKGDVACEKSMIDYFTALKLNADIVSEEHGVRKILGSKSEYTIYMDGIDGTTSFKKGKNSGTMVAIYEGRFPKFNDALASGVLFYSHGIRSEHTMIVSAARGFGAHKSKITAFGRDDDHRIKTSRKKDIEGARISYDSHWPINKVVFPKLFPEFELGCSDASCVDILNVAMGFTDLHGECARGPQKPTLEIPIAYLIVREAGGEIVSYDPSLPSELLGSSLGGVSLREDYNGKVVEFGSQIQYPVLVASTMQIAKEATKRFNELKNKKLK